MNSQTYRPAFIEQIRTQIRGIATPPTRVTPPDAQPDADDTLHQLFKVATGNRWLELGERIPIQKQLFGKFWFQNELCILYAAANTGKSILAVQISDALSRGRKAAPFAPRIKPQRVLYVDFELGTAQFSRRYGQPGQAYNFSNNFIRAEFNPDPALCPDARRYDELLINAIEYRVKWVEATVLIIDNITCLRGGTESAAVALRLLKNLKALQAAHNLSILVLAHTPKRRHATRPLCADDLHGSKLLISFADSAFAIGAPAKPGGPCYLKQIKQRNTEQVYHADNVCLCSIIGGSGLLRFKFHGYGTEEEQLQRCNNRREALLQKTAALTALGLSQRQISKKLTISLGLTNKLVRESVPIAIGSLEPRKTKSTKVGKVRNPDSYRGRKTESKKVEKVTSDCHAELVSAPHQPGSPMTDNPQIDNPLKGSPHVSHPSLVDLARGVLKQVQHDKGDILQVKTQVPKNVCDPHQPGSPPTGNPLVNNAEIVAQPIRTPLKTKPHKRTPQINNPLNKAEQVNMKQPATPPPGFPYGAYLPDDAPLNNPLIQKPGTGNAPRPSPVFTIEIIGQHEYERSYLQL